MPYEWSEPAVFMTHNGVKVYHTYKGGPGNEYQLDFWYTTEPCEADEDCGGDHTFDVRDLSVPLGTPDPPMGLGKRHKAIIAAAIDSGELPCPEGNRPASAHGYAERECVVQLPHGSTVRTPEHPADCEYVRIVGPNGNEVAYWDSAEWHEDPQGVMGAIMGAMASG